MIGVIANPREYEVICELFELFKTPWELHRSGRQYGVVLCFGDVTIPEESAKLVLIFGSCRLSNDGEATVHLPLRESKSRMLLYNGTPIPVYGSILTFRGSTSTLLDEVSGESVSYSCQWRGGLLVRLGYSLCDEVRTLLASGQPAANAAIPTLDLHIAVIRNAIVSAGIPLIEIPPVPKGYHFVACLTHDVDHPLVRRHKFDHTTFGFLFRATVGSLGQSLRGRCTFRCLLRNWVAAFKLPFVHLGLAKDFWGEFVRYAELEKDARSTFFVIPFEGHAGCNAPRWRASRYGAADIADQLSVCLSAGCEIGLHGIDAWWDPSDARSELEEIRRVTRQRNIGVRMHWLYYDDQSPVTLEEAGIDYDSTVGYNETVGYKAGTVQVYKPLGTKRLVELPMHVMDTALFYPNHLNLSVNEAWLKVSAMITNAVELGGCFTVNWHDRSIAPERLWGDFYVDLTLELRNRGAWLATAAEAVSWFRKRRSAKFETLGDCGEVRLRVEPAAGDNSPGLYLLCHNRAKLSAVVEAS